MTSSNESEGNSGSKAAKNDSDENRRNLLKVGVGISALLAVGGISAVAKSLISPGAMTPVTITTASTSQSSNTKLPAPATQGFPVLFVAHLGDLKVNSPIIFNYPLEDTPNYLVKLGEKADEGIGPEGDIVSFSQICQHLGCLYGFDPAGSSPKCNSAYKTSGPVGYCCCHGSVYDFLHDAKVISGPAPRPVPHVILKLDSSGNIYAAGMSQPTIFGHDTGSNDVSYDLQGGTLVS